MTPHARVRDEGVPTWSEYLLEEILRQLPLGLICTDLEGEVLFMNAAAQALLACESPGGGCESQAAAPPLPALPADIRRGLDYFAGLVAQQQSRSTPPFPKLSVRHHAGYDVEFSLYGPLDELTCDTREHARVVILLKSATLVLPTANFAKRFSLTRRERQVLQLLIEGRARKEIAAEMHLSEDTVRSYLHSLYEKLGVRSRVEAATLGLRMELLEHLKSVLQIPK